MEWNTIQMQAHSLYEKLHDVHLQYYDFWINHVLFTWRWWVALSLIILPWVIWILVRKKESTDRLLYVAGFVMVFSSALDMIGLSLDLWYYPVTAFPLMPEFNPFDICALPVATMLFIQYFPTVSPYIKAIVYSITSSYIFEPLNVWLGLYRLVHWKYYYSVPIMFFLYLLANYISSRNEFEKLK